MRQARRVSPVLLAPLALPVPQGRKVMLALPGPRVLLVPPVLQGRRVTPAQPVRREPLALRVPQDRKVMLAPLAQQVPPVPLARLVL